MSLQAIQLRSRRSLCLSIFLTAVLFIASCGPKSLRPFGQQKTNSSLAVSQALKHCSSQEVDSFESIQELFKKHQLGFQWLSRISTESINKKESFTISYLSREKLDERAKVMLAGSLNEESTDTLQQAIKFKDLLYELSKLKEEIERLEFLECHIDDYYRSGKIPFISYVELVKGEIHNDKIIDICAVFRNIPACMAEVRIAQLQGHMSQIINKYRQKFEAVFLRPRFNLSSPLKDIECKREDGETVLSMPINASKSDLEKVIIAANWWSSQSEEFRLKIIASSEPYAVSITHVEAGPSHVNMQERRQIHLGPGLSHPLIIAHEIGHILGFPDCYFEAWDQERSAFVYIELDPSGNNLMCNVKQSSKIPNNYFQQLKAKYCN